MLRGHIPNPQLCDVTAMIEYVISYDLNAVLDQHGKQDITCFYCIVCMSEDVRAVAEDKALEIARIHTWQQALTGRVIWDWMSSWKVTGMRMSDSSSRIRDCAAAMPAGLGIPPSAVGDPSKHSSCCRE